MIPTRRTAAALAALGALTMVIGAVPGTFGTAAAVEFGQLLIKGRPIVVKKQSGDVSILVASDAHGEVRLTGLEPGTYNVRVVEGAQQTPMRVGPDGQLAFVAWQETKSPDPRARSAQPVVRRWAEQIAFEGGNGGSGVGELKGGSVIVALRASQIDLDLNTSGTEQIRTLTNSPEAARAIIAERAGGPFSDVIDFAQRICPQTSVDFQDASLRFGDQTMLVKRGGDPKAAGFRCARGTGELELFGARRNYVGHVTLLK